MLPSVPLQKKIFGTKCCWKFKPPRLTSVFLFQSWRCAGRGSVDNDEGSVRQLCGAENVRRGGHSTAEEIGSVHPAPHTDAPEVHLRQTHHQ